MATKPIKLSSLSRPNPISLRNLPFAHQHMIRGMGTFPYGSTSPVPPGFEAVVTLRNNIKCGNRGCDQLLFNNDGSILFVSDDERRLCRLVDPLVKNKFVGSIKLRADCRLKEMMMTGEQEMATISVSPECHTVEPCVKFWDVRSTRLPVGFHTFRDRTAYMSAVYSKKDKLFLTLDRAAAKNRLATYSREGVLQDSSDGMHNDFSKEVKSIALSPNEGVLVMQISENCYTNVRNLDLVQLFEDIKHFNPAFQSRFPRRFAPAYADLYDQSGREVNNVRSPYRNSAEVMFYKTNSNVRTCPCVQAYKTVVFSPRSDFFAGHIESYKDSLYALDRLRLLKCTVLLFDLLEIRVAHRRSLDPQPQQYAVYGNNNHLEKSYLNPPVCRVEDDLYYGRIYDPKTRPYSQSLYAVPPLEYEPSSYCFLLDGKLAVTTLANRHLIATANDRFNCKIYVCDDKLALVQEMNLMPGPGLRRLAFSPKDSSLVLSDCDEDVQWYDMEYQRPVSPDAVAVKEGQHSTRRCRIL